MSAPIEPRLGFRLQSSDVRDLILLPKYYDPELDRAVEELRGSHDLLTLRALIDDGHVATATGHEIGKMAYGTGVIPFVRTSDITNWEIKANPKQSVSENIYKEYAKRQEIDAGDILFVRDGTYLIGTVAMVTKGDIPLLYQSHIVRIRVEKSAPISNRVLLAALTSDLVQRQLQARRFTSDIIDTVGDRYLDVVLPITKDSETRHDIDARVKEIIDERARLREEIARVAKKIVS